MLLLRQSMLGTAHLLLLVMLVMLVSLSLLLLLLLLLLGLFLPLDLLDGLLFYQVGLLTCQIVLRAIAMAPKETAARPGSAECLLVSEGSWPVALSEPQRERGARVHGVAQAANEAKCQRFRARARANERARAV